MPTAPSAPGQATILTATKSRSPSSCRRTGYLTDIRAIGISGSDSKVYVWYNDGALSIGGSRDLGLYRKVEWDKDGNLKQKVKLPSGKSMLNVVGIDIAKSNDHVYIWYE